MRYFLKSIYCKINISLMFIFLGILFSISCSQPQPITKKTTEENLDLTQSFMPITASVLITGKQKISRNIESVSVLPSHIVLKQNEQIITSNKEISFHEINNIIKYRCGVCHTTKPTFEGYEDPPLGIVYDSPVDILKNIDKIKAQAIDSDIMPPGNLTGITESERNKISLWIDQGANINN